MFFFSLVVSECSAGWVRIACRLCPDSLPVVSGQRWVSLGALQGLTWLVASGSHQVRLVFRNKCFLPSIMIFSFNSLGCLRACFGWGGYLTLIWYVFVRHYCNLVADKSVKSGGLSLVLGLALALVYLFLLCGLVIGCCPVSP